MLNRISSNILGRTIIIILSFIAYYRTVTSLTTVYFYALLRSMRLVLKHRRFSCTKTRQANTVLYIVYMCVCVSFDISFIIHLSYTKKTSIYIYVISTSRTIAHIIITITDVISRVMYFTPLYFRLHRFIIFN